MILEQLLKIKKKDKNWNSGHSCKFVPSYMNTIDCLNNVFHYYVPAVFFQPHFISSQYGDLPRLFKSFKKEDNSNVTRTTLWKA